MKTLSSGHKRRRPEHHWKARLLDRLSDLTSYGKAGLELSQIMQGKSSSGVHLAVFAEPYLEFIFDGRKTIESRFSINRHPPFEQVKTGDVILLKRSSGPVCGLCIVSNVWFYQLDPTSWDAIDDFAEALCMDDSTFWRDKRKAAAFATLMRIDSVAKIPDLRIDKLDPRSWVVLRPASSGQIELL